MRFPPPGPADVLDVFEIKTSHTGKISADQLFEYRRMMGGRDPVEVWTVKRLRVVNGVPRVVDNARAKHKKRFGAKVAKVGAVLAAVSCIVSVANGEEQEKYEIFIEETQRFRAQEEGLERDVQRKIVSLACLDWMSTWCPSDVVTNLTGMVILYSVENEWEQVETGE